MVGTVVVAMAAAALIWVAAPIESGPSGWTWTPQAPEVITRAPEALAMGTHPLHDDVVEVAEGAQVWAEQTGPITRLRLDAGTVTATVAPRAEAESFSIDADQYTVEVIGTQFSVQHDPFEVRVTEGTVEVIDRDGPRWSVTAGEWFKDGRVHRRAQKEARRTVVPLEDLQKMVLDGDPATARTHLERRLKRDPTDASAWRLLAQIEEQTGQVDAAVTAWLSLVEQGSPSQKQSARFEAARLLGARPAEAIPLLEAFLQASHPLSGEARLRLATAYAEVGRTADASAVLEDAARIHAGTAVGAEARRRLQSQPPAP